MSNLIATTTTWAGLELYRGRRHWPDEGFTDFTVLRFSPERLSFRDIDQSDPRAKIHALAHLRFVKALSFGRPQPRVVTWLRLSEDRPAVDLFPGISAETEQGETFLSANSLITYTLRQLLHRGWMRYDHSQWLHEIPAGETVWRERADAILAFLTREDRIHLYAGPGVSSDDDDLSGIHPTEDLIPIDRLGYVRDLVWRENPLAAFNTAYFLLEHNDFLSHHSALGEPYSLFVSGGVIRRPPLYRRSALWQRGDGKWAIDMFGLEDMALTLSTAGAKPLPFSLNRPDAVTAYTRRWAIAEQGRVIGYTPDAPGRYEYTIVDCRVTGHKRGGSLEIPQNGFVLSLDHSALTPTLHSALTAGRVGYRFRSDEHRGMRQAIQVGPRLLRGGEMALSETSLADEDFWIDRILPDGSRQVGVVPSDYPDDVDRTRAGRVGLGITASGDLMATVMMGSETKGVKHPGLDSAGATLVELAELMGERGAVEAVNLDGGGSSQLFFLGGATTVPGNRLGLQSVHYERMVPSVGVVS